MSGGGDEDNEEERNEMSDQTDEGESPTLAEVSYDKVFLPSPCLPMHNLNHTFASWPPHLWFFER
jgi:hypothetical protein